MCAQPPWYLLLIFTLQFNNNKRSLLPAFFGIY